MVLDAEEDIYYVQSLLWGEMMVWMTLGISEPSTKSITFQELDAAPLFVGSS